jgi:hypothetical protein
MFSMISTTICLVFRLFINLNLILKAKKFIQFYFFCSLVLKQLVLSQICYSSQINQTISQCKENNFCYLSTGLCKCNSSYFGSHCNNKVDLEGVKTESGIKANDYFLMVLLQVFTYASTLPIGLCIIFICFNQILIHSEEKKEEEDHKINDIVISIKNEQREDITEKPSLINNEQRQFDEIQILISNFEMEIDQLDIEKSSHITNILENLHNYFTYCRIPNKIVNENIFEEVENLLNYLVMNRLDYLNLDIDKYQTHFARIKGEKKKIDLKEVHLNLYVDDEESINKDKHILNNNYKKIEEKEESDIIINSEDRAINAVENSEIIILKKEFKKERIKDRVDKIKSFNIKIRKDNTNYSSVKKKNLSNIKSLAEDGYLKMQTSNPDSHRDFDNNK